MAAPFRPNPLPPTQIHSSQFTSSTEALDFLNNFLARAAVDPALQPNAIITQDGPKSRTTADAPNLTLHNLKRIQKGLGGEVMGSDLSLNATAAAAKSAKSRGANTTNGDAAADTSEKQWEDREKWELEQTDAVSDSAENLNNTTGKEIEVDENGMPVIDKEERKRAKKAKRKAERAQAILARTGREKKESSPEGDGNE